MDYLWGSMLLVGIIYGAFHGTLPAVTEAALASAKEAITLCITMAGVMALWVGLMKIAESGGMIKAGTRLLMPGLRFLFPHIPADDESLGYIATNMIANLLGLGWAATPAGLQAMKALKKLEEKRGTAAHYASNEMCIFLVMNISSLQLIPMNVIAYRSQYGSVHPAQILGPGMAATFCSTIAALLFCKIMGKAGIKSDKIHILGDKKKHQR